jgi:hypothetical protein
VGQEGVDRAVIEMTRGRQAGAQFDDRLPPVLGPERAAPVQRGFCRRPDVLYPEPGDHRGQPAADEVVNSLLARPGQPAGPERADFRRLGHADRQEIRLDQQDRPARPDTGHQVRHRCLRVAHVVQHRAGRHQVKVSRFDRPGQDVGLAELESGCVRTGQRQVEIHRHRPATGGDPPGQPGRHGAVTAARFKRPRSRPDAQPVNVAAVHRIEQPRHKG